MLRGHWKHTLKGSLCVSSKGPYGFRLRVLLGFVYRSLRVSSRGPYGFRTRVSLRASIQISDP